MAEQIEVIHAGSHPVYEVVVYEDKQTVTIRAAENHEDKFVLMSSVIPTLINVLRNLEL